MRALMPRDGRLLVEPTFDQVGWRRVKEPIKLAAAATLVGLVDEEDVDARRAHGAYLVHAASSTPASPTNVSLESSSSMCVASMPVGTHVASAPSELSATAAPPACDRRGVRASSAPSPVFSEAAGAVGAASERSDATMASAELSDSDDGSGGSRTCAVGVGGVLGGGEDGGKDGAPHVDEVLHVEEDARVRQYFVEPPPYHGGLVLCPELHTCDRKRWYSQPSTSSSSGRREGPPCAVRSSSIVRWRSCGGARSCSRPAGAAVWRRRSPTRPCTDRRCVPSQPHRVAWSCIELHRVARNVE